MAKSIKNKKINTLDLRSVRTINKDSETEIKSQRPKEKPPQKKRRFGIKFFSILIILILLTVAEGFLIKDYLDLKRILDYKNSIIQQQMENDKRKFEEIQSLKKQIEALGGGEVEKNSEGTKNGSESSSTAIDKASISIEVQNGSGTAGMAGTFSNKLKSLGYTKIVSIADADSDSYTGITIKYPTSKKSEAEIVRKDLEQEYKISFLELNTGSLNIAVIIGK